MEKGRMMSYDTIIDWLLGLVAVLSLLLLGRTHTKASEAHQRIDSERIFNDHKVDEIHKKINQSINTVNTCRSEVDSNIHKLTRTLMTEAQVKDFVDRSIKPIEKSINAVHSDVKVLIQQGRGK